MPPRRLREDLDSVSAMVARSGGVVAVNAETASSIEWGIDQAAAMRMRDAYALTDAEHRDILERLRSRNRAIWGVHSRTDL